MTKLCNCCKRRHRIQDCIKNSYAANEAGYWFNCFCGSTLLIKVQVIDYRDVNRIVVREPANVLNYKKGA